MEITWKHYSDIKNMLVRHGLLNLEPEKYNAVIRDLLEILGL